MGRSVPIFNGNLQMTGWLCGGRRIRMFAAKEGVNSCKPHRSQLLCLLTCVILILASDSWVAFE